MVSRRRVDWLSVAAFSAGSALGIVAVVFGTAVLTHWVFSQIKPLGRLTND